MNICVGISCEANLGHVMSGALCPSRTANLHMAMTKVFISMDVIDFVLFSHMPHNAGYAEQLLNFSTAVYEYNKI